MKKEIKNLIRPYLQATFD